MEMMKHNSYISKVLERGLFHPHVNYAEHYFQIPGLSTQETLLHISDLHFGQFLKDTWLPLKTQQQVAEHIVSVTHNPNNPPSVLLFTGDLGTKLSEAPWLAPSSADTMYQILEPFKNITIPKYATLGNHDTHSNDVRQILEEVGFILSPEETVSPVLANHSDELSIWSVPDFTTEQKKHQDVIEFIQNISEGINPEVLPIVLAHNPDSFDSMPANFRYLGLSGHTHAGAYSHNTLKSFAAKKLGLKNGQYLQNITTTQHGNIIHTSPGAGRHLATPMSDEPMAISMLHLCPVKI